MIERVVALAVLAGSGVYLANGSPLTLGTAARPGPGFYPLGVGVFGAAVALVWVARTLRRSPASASAAVIDAEGRGRVGATAGLLLGFCLLLPWVGYPVAAFLFTGLMLRALGARWVPALVIALGSALASFYVFGVVLGVPLPRGLLLD